MRALPLLIGLTLAACGAPPHGPVFNHCQVPTDGILLLRWTVRGAAPTNASCTGIGIDHLELTFDTQSCGGGTIAPVPCALDKFRYDELPRGAALISLAAVDALGNLVASGMTQADLEPNAQAAPATLDLR